MQIYNNFLCKFMSNKFFSGGQKTTFRSQLSPTAKGINEPTQNIDNVNSFFDPLSPLISTRSYMKYKLFIFASNTFNFAHLLPLFGHLKLFLLITSLICKLECLKLSISI